MQGQPASAGQCFGPVRVLHDVSDLRSVQAGDVLVLEMADRRAAAVFGIAAALVTEAGGALSNLATLARERGTPYVAGVVGAMTKLRDGDRVLVDGNTGAITLIPIAADSSERAHQMFALPNVRAA
jgi:pyruvate,water dikinase